MNEGYRMKENNIPEDEEHFRDADFEQEMQFYEHVRTGDVEYIRESMQQPEAELYASEYSILSENPIRNIRYQAIVMASLASRFCMQSGMDPTVAYETAERYIRQVDVLNTKEDIMKLIKRMMVDFTKRMKQQKRKNHYSKNIVKSMDYIHHHIYEKCTAEEVAEYCGLHPGYLSRLFKEEVQMGISEYIRTEKIEVAKNKLKYTDDSYMDIANILAFSSQSHFGKVFRAFVGMTPKEYRDRYYHRQSEENI